MRAASGQETAAAPEVSQASNSKRYARVDGVYNENIDRRFSNQGLSKRCVLKMLCSLGRSGWLQVRLQTELHSTCRGSDLNGKLLPLHPNPKL